MRAQLLESLRARIRAAERREDGGDVLSWEALSEAVGLLSHRRSQGLDLEALVTAGLLFFHRAMRQRPERRLVEMVAAAQLLGPVYASAPHLVPARVRAFYANGQDPWEHFSAGTGFTTDPYVWWELHKDPTQRYLVSDEDRAGLACLSLALALLRLARLSAGPSHPLLPQVLTGTAALLGLYRAATGDLAACREAVEVGRAALRELPRATRRADSPSPTPGWPPSNWPGGWRTGRPPSWRSAASARRSPWARTRTAAAASTSGARSRSWRDWWTTRSPCSRRWRCSTRQPTAPGRRR
ncbi:hypothetical protein [Streptomyces sp. NPDC049949]|uniref:hypothetical protein n=1 Tax=Streptomyces sp. NPDC049949 TaxID=3154627 RepID=UPI003419814A